MGYVSRTDQQFHSSNVTAAEMIDVVLQARLISEWEEEEEKGRVEERGGRREEEGEDGV